jgi:hypothetical protein
MLNNQKSGVCDGRLTCTKLVLKTIPINIDIKEAIKFFRWCGCSCDCAVLHSAEKRSKRRTKEYMRTQARHKRNKIKSKN